MLVLSPETKTLTGSLNLLFVNVHHIGGKFNSVNQNAQLERERVRLKL